MDIRTRKTELRSMYLARRAAIPAAEKERRDARICDAILSSASYRYANTVLAYFPRENEVDIRPALRAALAAGKRVALPRCEAEHIMHYRYVEDLDSLCPGSFGICEPGEDAPLYREEEGSTLCLVPGVVFDRRGYRIGYGGGYYDRFLHRYHGSVAGIVYRDFIVDTPLPFGRFDLPLPVMITDSGIVCAK